MPAAYTEDFPNGVSAGDVTQTSAILWTRAIEAGRLRLQVATDPFFKKIVETQKVNLVDPAVPVKFSVDHLKAGTEYFYRFIDASGDVINGSFATSAAPGIDADFHFGVISDTHGIDRAPFVALKNAPAADLDLLVKLGDQIFADQPPPGASTLAEFRAEHNAIYSAQLGFNVLAELQGKTPILAIPDDAELVNNWAGGASPDTDPRFAGQAGDFINETPLASVALQAFGEFNAIADRVYRHTGDDLFNGAPDLYRYNSYGSSAAVFMLDARSFRDAELTSPLNPLDTAEVLPFLGATFESDRSMLGDVQLARLMQDLLDARDKGVTWKFVMLPEPIQNFGPIVDAGDRFEGYAAERSALLKFIDDNHIENVVFVSGDSHWYSVNNLTYQEHAGGPQIASSTFEVQVPAVGGDLIGPLVAPTAASVGLIGPDEVAYYNSLPTAPDADSIPDDKDDFVESVLNAVLDGGGYDRLGLDDNLAVADGKIHATLLEGAHFASHNFGWSDFNIDGATGKLTVTTWGVPDHSPADLATNLDAILAFEPAIIGRFDVTPTSDAIIGTARGDKLGGTDGDDVILGAAGSDSLRGGGGGDYLDGGVFRDAIRGGAGDDELFGRRGRDELRGGEGNDTLVGGDGDDDMIGGAGSDIFVFAPGFGKDRIKDFDPFPKDGQDRIDLRAFRIAAEEFGARVKISDMGAHVQVVIDGDPDQSMQLFGVSKLSAVTQADFLL